MREISYLRAIVIVHGKSELQMCEFIKSKLRLRFKIISEKNGRNSIQMNSVMNTLNDMNFKSLEAFKRRYKDEIEICQKDKKKEISDDFKIFIIMDTDDCKEYEKKAFINGNMFKKHWAHPYIVPIYNINNLEEVLEKSSVKFEKKGNERKSEYVRIFPTDKKYTNNEGVQIDELRKSILDNTNTNMEIFLTFCLNLANENFKK